jgi:hypothetical protein
MERLIMRLEKQKTPGKILTSSHKRLKDWEKSSASTEAKTWILKMLSIEIKQSLRTTETKRA